MIVKRLENLKLWKSKRGSVVVGILIFFLACPTQGEAQTRITLRNNLLYDAALTPNLGTDISVGAHWSLGLNAGYRPWPASDETSRKWRHLLLAPELRHWRDSVFADRGSYWGLNLVYSHFNVADVSFPLGLYRSVRHNRLQGDLAALGAFYGYSWRLSRLFRLEAEAGLGVGYAWAKQYACGHCGTYMGRDDKPFLVPKLALNLVLDPRKRPVPAPEPEPQPEPAKKPEPVFIYNKVLPRTVGDSLSRMNPVLCEYKDYRPYDRTRIMRRDTNALFVHFPVDKTTLLPAFRDNAATLDRIVNVTRLIMADTLSSVRLIQIIGFASIEGSVAHNEQLGMGRALALKQYVQQHVPQAADSLFELNNGAEAWAEFRDQVAELVPDNAELAQVLTIIDTEPDADRREQRLRQLNGGRTWQYIKQHILADQRNSGYLRIYFDRVPDPVADTINHAASLLRHERYAEALALLRNVSADPRSWNALGVSLYMTGNRQQALLYFRRAAQQGNADAKRNLQQLTMNN